MILFRYLQQCADITKKVKGGIVLVQLSQRLPGEEIILIHVRDVQVGQIIASTGRMPLDEHDDVQWEVGVVNHAPMDGKAMGWSEEETILIQYEPVEYREDTRYWMFKPDTFVHLIIKDL